MSSFLTDMIHHAGICKWFKRSFFAAALFAVCCTGNAQAQYGAPAKEQDTATHMGFDPQKLFAGGNVGLSFGDITYINLSPLIGYRFSDMFAAGFQINAQYESVRYVNADNTLYQKEKYGVLGAGIFGRFYPIPQLFLHIQPEMNFIFGKVKYYDGSPEQKYREQVPSFLAGGGYSQPVGGNSAFTIMILYDVLQNPDSPYGNRPVFRAGVNLGF